MREFEKLVERLKREGWRQQNAGSVYLNGRIATNFVKDGAMLSVTLDYWPDEELVEEHFGEADA